MPFSQVALEGKAEEEDSDNVCMDIAGSPAAQEHLYASM